MGAGVSSKRLARVEEQIRAKDNALRKVQEELAATKNELEKVKEQLGSSASLGSDSPLKSPQTVGSRPRWEPCRVNRDPAQAQSKVLVYHDGENCWVPNHPDMKFGRIFDSIVDLLCPYFAGEDPRKKIRNGIDYSFFLTRKEDNPFHPHSTYWNDMDTLGVHLESVGDKKDAVDVKMKAFINRRAQDQTGEGTIVLVITGDKDFSHELQALKKAGFFVILLHRNNINKTRVMEECCDVAFNCWDLMLFDTHPSISDFPKMIVVPKSILESFRKQAAGIVKPDLLRESNEESFLSAAGHKDAVLVTLKGGAKVKETCNKLKKLVTQIEAGTRNASLASQSSSSLPDKDSDTTTVENHGSETEDGVSSSSTRRSPGETIHEVPVDQAGLIVGPKHQTIKKLMKETGAKITIPAKPRGKDAMQKIFIEGTAEERALALAKIEEIIASGKPASPASQARSRKEIAKP